MASASTIWFLSLGIVTSVALVASTTLMPAVDRTLARITTWAVAGPPGPLLRPVVQPSDELGVFSVSLCLTTVLVAVLCLQGWWKAGGTLAVTMVGLSVGLAMVSYPDAEAARVTLVTASEAMLLPGRWRQAGIVHGLTLSVLAILSRVDSGIPGTRAILGMLAGAVAAAGWVLVTRALETVGGHAMARHHPCRCGSNRA
jgi:hypothetical protein